MDLHRLGGCLVALALAGCGREAAPPATPDIDRGNREAMASIAPTAREVLAGWRTGRYGCAATDQEYWLTERSGRVLHLAQRRTDINTGGQLYVYAPKTTGRQFFFVMRSSPTRVTTGRLREHGPVEFGSAPG